jgi:hypothetical protein
VSVVGNWMLLWSHKVTKPCPQLRWPMSGAEKNVIRGGRDGRFFVQQLIKRLCMGRCLEKGKAICREEEAMEKKRVSCSVSINRWCAAKSRVITSALHFFTVRKTRLLYHMILTLFTYAPFYENPDY